MTENQYIPNVSKKEALRTKIPTENLEKKAFILTFPPHTQNKILLHIQKQSDNNS